ncbi:MAG TPA: RNA 2',3'-cyclic phosphodiesterase [Polyangiaceae bacterium]|nr:RNA 2',3'-cyclic phosphodiesterase [Polyangiaceae bacterium]
MNERRAARVFLAVGISMDIADVVARLQKVLEQNAPAGLFRFVDAQQAHVTLRFLGQRTPGEQDRIVRAAAPLAKETVAFALAFGALGVFPDERRPHTLWMGLTEGRSELIELAARLQVQLAAAGFTPEGRPYVPHLTLARVKQRPPAGLMNAILAAAAAETPVQSVESFALMESRSTAAGVRYVPLCTFRLENPCTPSK